MFFITDPPGSAQILTESSKGVTSDNQRGVVKGESVTLTCDVTELGRPEAHEYVWTRAGHVVKNVDTANWTIDPVSLETEANISCVAMNLVGGGQPDFISLDVLGE